MPPNIVARKRSAPTQGAPGRSHGNAAFRYPNRSGTESRMPVEPLPRALRDYIRAFDLRALCIYRGGRIGVSLNPPRDCERAWWCEARNAGAVIRAARKDSGDVP